MKKFSTINKVRLSNGETISRASAERKIREAKAEKVSLIQYCEVCGTTEGYLDCSHNVSVKKCFEIGAEMAWDVNNITIRCRNCHKIHDKL